MAVDDLRLQARQELERIGVSPESASFLVHDRPHGGWESLVTTDQLSAELADVRGELRREIADLRGETREEFGKVRAEIAGLAAELRKEMQSQTRWLTVIVVGSIGAVATIGRVL